MIKIYSIVETKFVISDKWWWLKKMFFNSMMMVVLKSSPPFPPVIKWVYTTPTGFLLVKITLPFIDTWK